MLTKTYIHAAFSVLLFPLACPACAQAPSFSFRNPTTMSIGGEYSNNSNHLIIGKAYNRRLTGLALTYSLRLAHTRIGDWYYDAELRPLQFLQDPISTTTKTVQFGNQAPFGPFPVQSGPIPSRCQSAVITNPDGTSPNSTTVQTRVCGTRWTYAGGMSPLGQRINFMPRRRAQPYLLLNAGFLVSPHNIPSDYSSSFNFTFAFGGGIQFNCASGRSWSLDYRIHHLSNRNIGDSNPGIDNQLLRLSYTFPMHHRVGESMITRPAKLFLSH